MHPVGHARRIRIPRHQVAHGLALALKIALD
jgi:hypothetical protein